MAPVFKRRHRNASASLKRIDVICRQRTKSNVTIKILQTLTAVIEVGAGLSLLGIPSTAAVLLLGTPLESPVAVSVARVGGTGLLALAIACWGGRRDPHGVVSRGLVVAILFYNVAVVGVLVFANFGFGLYGVLLWPAVALHTIMAIWCIASLFHAE